MAMICSKRLGRHGVFKERLGNDRYQTRSFVAPVACMPLNLLYWLMVYRGSHTARLVRSTASDRQCVRFLGELAAELGEQAMEYSAGENAGQEQLQRVLM